MSDQALSSLLRINRQRLRTLRTRLSPYKYTGTMHLILLYTNHKSGASQEEITCFYALDKTSVARDAKRLEDMGHIRREINQCNRRQYQLYLTGEGKKMVPIINQAYDDFVDELSRDFTDDEWEIFSILLKKAENTIYSESH